MAKRYDIAFVETDSPITEPVTKFGGQPVWLEEPRWPLSTELGEQMQFVCQVALEPEVFGKPPGRMAYLFITGESEDEWVDGTFDPEGGENAVMVQPGGGPPAVGTVPEPEGPTLYRMEDFGTRLIPVACEYAVELTPGDDPDYASEDELLDWNEEESDAYQESLDGNKVGGTPGFIQSDEFPEGPGKAPQQAWRLLLQLDSASVPFHVNFGDAGIGYAYLSEGGRTGKFLWQCY